MAIGDDIQASIMAAILLKDMGIRVAHQLVSPNLLDYIELSKEYTIAEMSATSKIAGFTLKDLDTRAKYGCSIVAINKKTGVVIAPAAEDQVDEKDIMVVIGMNDQIDAFEKAIND